MISGASIAAIACPTLVMHGGDDRLFAQDHAQSMVERIPGAALWFDPRMGHTMHEETWPEMADRVAHLAGL